MNWWYTTAVSDWPCVVLILVSFALVQLTWFNFKCRWYWLIDFGFVFHWTTRDTFGQHNCHIQTIRCPLHQSSSSSTINENYNNNSTTHFTCPNRRRRTTKSWTFSSINKMPAYQHHWIRMIITIFPHRPTIVQSVGIIVEITPSQPIDKRKCDNFQFMLEQSRYLL